MESCIEIEINFLPIFINFDLEIYKDMIFLLNPVDKFIYLNECFHKNQQDNIEKNDLFYSCDNSQNFCLTQKSRMDFFSKQSNLNELLDSPSKEKINKIKYIIEIKIPLIRYF